ncbi:hypothetical protein [Iodobacter fluviatilis]|uniref:Uncharacterized protein n=1 Tax=Iodobacter fluviatilis TaxID=537 RepID=A0A7G3G4D6_9NEIS|nr:hypothetical protein [Iodobacter fluviatilis]QBC42101.1 hypothetical protein C1H71_00025 [Iodobacter fluviatilis]QBC45573.1 hypothetical protein C1H71_19960 [Iodobacter fluviatilis]
MSLYASKAIRLTEDYNEEVHENLDPYLEVIFSYIWIYAENGASHCEIPLKFHVLRSLENREVELIKKELRRMGYKAECGKSSLKVTWLEAK